MIYGIGTDIVDSSRIAQSLERFGERFARRILTDAEWLEFNQSSKPIWRNLISSFILISIN